MAPATALDAYRTVLRAARLAFQGLFACRVGPRAVRPL